MHLVLWMHLVCLQASQIVENIFALLSHPC
uniref:Uncharacterized protein n=1 Tax=Arundo donax TaxID=35708 RepID=A0A0A8ZL71_ARUDO